MRSNKMSAFTLLEVMSCIVIMTVLLSLLAPVLGRVKMSAKITASKSSLRNLFLATSLYQSDYEGTLFGEPSSMGLPYTDDNGNNPALREILAKTLGPDPNHYSPCGRHPFNSNGPLIEYLPSNRPDWKRWISKLESRMVLFADGNCNTGEIDINDQYVLKTGVAVALDGHAFNIQNDQSHIWLQDFYLRGIQ